MQGQGDNRDFFPPVIEDGLFTPLIILVVAMVLVPGAAGILFDLVAQGAGMDLSPVDASTLRTGVGLIAQGIVLFAWPLRRVAGRDGLGLSAASLGLASPGPGTSWSREAAAGLAAGIGLIALNVIGSWLTQRLFGLFMDPETLAQYAARESASVVDALGGGASGWIVLLLPVVAVVVAPISEEVFFRGYLYGVLRSRFTGDPWYAAYWSSAVFAVVHFYFIHFIPVFLIGMALVYLYRKRGSLVAPIVAHATSNFVVTVASLISHGAT